MVDSTDEEAMGGAIYTLATDQISADTYEKCGRRYIEENLRWTSWFVIGYSS